MATIKKNAVKAPKTAAPKPVAPKAIVKSTVTKPNKEKNGDELVVDNIAELSKVVSTLSATLDLLVKKAEGMAYHIVATEAILAELVTANGLNLARVNARIRAKIAAGTDSNGDANQAIDAAAAIASPLPRR
ncbi:MAG: hypothetical protein A2076_04310 [Geobacteraceae bacterium GWC2_53_11]|nr:MAG: hypothetical protein A2076_04310 [Geobacteraceae bacterium GWC2_53_11]